MRLIEDYNVNRFTFEWGGVELISQNDLLHLLGWSVETLNHYIGLVGENSTELAEGIEYFNIEWMDLSELIPEARRHLFGDLDLRTEIPCYSKYCVSAILSESCRESLNFWFSPFDEPKVDVSKLLM